MSSALCVGMSYYAELSMCKFLAELVSISHLEQLRCSTQRFCDLVSIKYTVYACVHSHCMSSMDMLT